MLNVPPGATVNAPSKSPPDQFSTPFELTVLALFIVSEAMFSV